MPLVLVIGIIYLSEYNGVGKLNDDKLQAANEVVKLIDDYNKGRDTSGSFPMLPQKRKSHIFDGHSQQRIFQ